MQDRKRFLIDANILITAKNNFYPFDIAISFWQQMEQNISDGNIIILQAMAEEIFKGKDQLSEWIQQFESGIFFNQKKDEDVFKEYANVLAYLQSSPFYSASALDEWAKENVADGWLIATAKAKKVILITLETPFDQHFQNSPHKKAKIPDVCKALNVECRNLIYMMRTLQMKM